MQLKWKNDGELLEAGSIVCDLSAAKAVDDLMRSETPKTFLLSNIYLRAQSPAADALVPNPSNVDAEICQFLLYSTYVSRYKFSNLSICYATGWSLTASGVHQRSALASAELSNLCLELAFTWGSF